MALQQSDDLPNSEAEAYSILKLRSKESIQTFRYVTFAISVSALSVLLLLIVYGNKKSSGTDDIIPFTSSDHERDDAEFVRRVILRNEENYKKHMAKRELRKKAIPCKGRRSIWICGNVFFQMTYLIPPYTCFIEIHLAEWGEGGKWLCDIPKAIPRKTGVVYSVGSKGSIGFETAVYKELGIKSFTFDPTLTEMALKKVRSVDFINVYEIGLSGSDDLEAELVSLNQTFGVSRNAQMLRIDGIMSLLNHSYIDVLKMDCEGCEKSVIAHLATIATREKPLFGQGLFEFHRLNETMESQLMFDTLEGLGYRTFHAEANFYFPKNCWEIGFIHESLIFANAGIV